jgi:hypothetical protein
MKYALCLHGYFQNPKLTINMNTNNYIEDNIIKKIITSGQHTLDIFIHSFDLNNKDNIIKKYSKYLVDNKIEQQINFFEFKFSNENKEYLKKITDLNYKSVHSYNFHSVLSSMYTRDNSIKLALKYSKKNNIKYNLIISTRFDLGVRINKYNLIFNPEQKYNDKYLYSAFWNQLNGGIYDFWFFGNQNNMEILSNSHDYFIKNYFKINSEYVNMIENGWFDSNKDYPWSNIMLLSNEEKKKYLEPPNLYSCSMIHSVNSHYIYKFYLYKTKLYNICKFIDDFGKIY